jgi:hypothetical protein
MISPTPSPTSSEGIFVLFYPTLFRKWEKSGSGDKKARQELLPGLNGYNG